MRSVARNGNIPPESTASNRTLSFFAAAATIRGIKKHGHSSLTTTQAP